MTKQFQNSGFNSRTQQNIVLGFVFLKLLVGTIFSSDYPDNIFIPFVKHFLQNRDNPWEYFYLHDPGVAFPYPPLMLYLLIPVVALSKLFSSVQWAGAFFLTVLQLAFDLILLRTLKKLIPKIEVFHLLVWGLSPLILFSTYGHGQLDIIPTVFLFTSTYYLTRGRWIQSTLIFGCALTSKFHTVLALPFFLVFLYRRYGLSIKNIHQYLAFVFFPILLYFLFAFPFFLSEGYQIFVHQNREQTLVFEAFQKIGDLKILLAPTALALIFGRFLVYPRVNKDLLLSYLALTFSVFVFLVPPAPGWYLWGYPFVLVILFKHLPRVRYSSTLLLLWNLSYLIYFIFFYHHPFNDLSSLKFLGKPIAPIFSGFELGRNLSFSILEIATALIIYNIYKQGILSNPLSRLKAKAFAIGISGDSGSGKTTLLELLKSLLGQRNLLQIEGDGDHKWERGDKNWDNLTHLNPRANFLHRQALQIEDLKKGRTTRRSEYDHHTGKFLDLKTVRPAFFLALSGLHAFYLPRSRNALDLKVFLAPDEDLRINWKIERDMKERGHDADYIKAQLQKRKKDADRYINPQREFADLVFSLYGPEKLIIECGPGLDLDSFEGEGITISRDFTMDCKRQIVEVQGIIPAKVLSRLCDLMIPNRDDFLDGEIVFHDGMSGVMQLFILLTMANKMQEA